MHVHNSTTLNSIQEEAMPQMPHANTDLQATRFEMRFESRRAFLVQCSTEWYIFISHWTADPVGKTKGTLGRPPLEYQKPPPFTRCAGRYGAHSVDRIRFCKNTYTAGSACSQIKA